MPSLPRLTRAISGLAALLVIAPVIRAAVAGSVWSGLHSTDLPTYAANLRAAGAPESSVALLVSSEINARFQQREAELQPSLNSVEELRRDWSAERRELVLALKQEKNDLLRKVLGVVPDETAKPVHIPETLAHLTKPQRDAVQVIVNDYNAMHARLFTESRGVLLEEDQAKLRYLDEARAADLVKALGSENALDYEIGSSGLMRGVMNKIALFKPTRQELRDIFTIHRKHGYEIAIRSGPNGRQNEIRKVIEAELEALWGTDRFAQYRARGSTVFPPIFHLVQRLGLPPEVADKLYASGLAAREKPFRMVEEMRARGGFRVEGGQLPPRPPDISREAIAEHLAFVRGLLGEAGSDQYRQVNIRWIESMERGGMMRLDDSTLPEPGPGPRGPVRVEIGRAPLPLTPQN